MNKVYLFLAEGFEEIEALTVVDLLRRVNIPVEMISITSDKVVTGGHQIKVVADAIYEEVSFSEVAMLVLPGGALGTQNLESFKPLLKEIELFHEQNKYIAAICAAPSIFAHLAILDGVDACVNPAFELHLQGANLKLDDVIVAGNIITSRAMGTAIPFALSIIETLINKETAEQLGRDILYYNK